MSKLSNKGIYILEKLFIQSGYVLDFSNNSFQRFISNSIQVNIYEDKGYETYTSKGKKLLELITNESNDAIIKLINDLIDYFTNSKVLKGEKLKEREIKLIEDLKSEVNLLKLSSSEFIGIDETIDDRIREISTRHARFNDMAQDEKLKELSNLLEYLLKENKKFKVLSFDKHTFDFINDEDIKTYRKKLHIFRHSNKKTIQARKEISDSKKIFLINYGILIVNYISLILKN